MVFFLFGGRSHQTTAEQSNISGKWSEIPSLSNLITNQFSASSRNHVDFRMVRYSDQLQSYSNEYFTPGNIYCATKYLASMTDAILEVLIQATGGGDISPKNESKIMIQFAEIICDAAPRQPDEFQHGASYTECGLTDSFLIRL